MKNIKKVWVIGAEGRLGKAIETLLDRREVEVLTTDIDDVDVTDTQSIIRYGDINRPDVIINCAGMTSLEMCERKIEKAYKVNALGARNVSIAARKIGARLVHISTDDVFDGLSEVPYTEFDRPNPQNIYGKSKLAGEQFVKDFGHKYIIVRSSWIYGTGDNFVNQIIELCKTQPVIQVANDQFGSPTSAKELAKLVIYLMNTADYGLYHGVCEGSCSRYELAEEIVRLIGSPTKVEPCTTENNEECVNRPAYTVLDNFMLRISESYIMPDWKEALSEYIQSLKK